VYVTERVGEFKGAKMRDDMNELFRNEHEALVYAFNFQMQQYALSPMSKLAGLRAQGQGKGLVSTDGAAQAGMIRAKVDRLSPLHRHCIVARYSPQYSDCPCCGGHKPIQEWKEAIVALRDWSMSTFSGMSHASIREAIILHFYNKNVSLKDAADRVHAPIRNVYNLRSKIHEQLKLIDGAARAEIADALNSLQRSEVILLDCTNQCNI
jgi:hypothetical protein